MDDQNDDDTSAWKTEPFPLFFESSSSQSPISSQSEESSTNNQRSFGSESPPDLLRTPCRGRASGCHYPENDQPHCHLRCSPRACKQCREVLDADWVEKGRWLEDCVSIPEGEEEWPGCRGTTMGLVFKVIAAGVFAASLIWVLCCVWQARTNWALLQEWAATWAQL